MYSTYIILFVITWKDGIQILYLINNVNKQLHMH